MSRDITKDKALLNEIHDTGRGAFAAAGIGLIYIAKYESAQARISELEKLLSSNRLADHDEKLARVLSEVGYQLKE